MYPPGEKRFLKINFLTVVSLFVVILAGGIVRSTGSGMGCPDWPKCFDQYIPPTDVSQLPAGYQQKYVDQRVKKNERFARSLEAMGRKEMADSIRNDKSILQPEEFNAAKTWTEYINRLTGAVTGFFMIATLFASRVYLRTRKRIFFWSLFNLLLVGYQAWLGSIVVSTNLMAWIVTAHMLIAVAILAIAIYTYYDAKSYRDPSLKTGVSAAGIKWTIYVALVLTLIQITIGTEVREQIDWISSVRTELSRNEWVAQVGSNFVYHRDLAIAVVLVNVLLFVLIRRRFLSDQRRRFASLVILLIVIQVITGFALSYMGLPPVAQALHILIATMVFGGQFYLLLLFSRNQPELNRN